MTGERSLPGKVSPLGGVNQKGLAAHRAGRKEVILPKRNEADLDDLPESVRKEMQFHLASDVKEVLEIALEPRAAPTEEPLTVLPAPSSAQSYSV